MRLIYWLDKCPFTGRDRSTVESIIPNIKQIKLIRNENDWIYVLDGPKVFEISGPGIQAISENFKIRGIVE